MQNLLKLHLSRTTQVVLAALMFTSMLVTAAPSNAQSATPSIAFLNPSSFATNAAGLIVVSDQQPTRPSEGSGTYRLVAWTTGASSGAGVEFELLKEGLSIETIDASPFGGAAASSQTYEAHWNIPASVPNGTYQLRATLFENNEAIATAEEDVLLNSLADRVEITSPLAPLGRFGTFAALADALPGEGAASRSLPLGDIETVNTGIEDGQGTALVHAFYTVSPPGTEAEWIPCGAEGAPGDAPFPFASTAAHDGVRCQLAEASHETRVTAIAALAESSKEGDNPAAYGAGDAYRITESYAQVPTALSLGEGSTGVVVEADDEGNFDCVTASVQLTDQYSHEILGANMDVHASGPNDKLQFNGGQQAGLSLNPTWKNVAPDRNVHALEPTRSCLEGTNSRTAKQAEHQILGGPDIKHVETIASGTNDEGRWGGTFWIPAESATPQSHTVRYTFWLDEVDDGCLTNDDRFTPGELSVTGYIGYADRPQEIGGFSATEIAPCSPPLEGPAARTVTLDADRYDVIHGETVTLSGAAASPVPDCAVGQTVKLKWRRPGRRFKTFATAQTDAEGLFSADVTPRGGKNEYRAVIKATEELCLRGSSNVVRVVGVRT